MMATNMNLKILLPSHVFVKCEDVLQIVADTQEGSFGILPRRLDCVAALTPGILVYETEAEGEVFVAIDEGVLVKTGFDVLISVRRAIAGSDLEHLRAAVDQEFLTLNEHEATLRSVMAKLEVGLMRRFATFQHE